ncbi:MAG: molybdenum ABC transporter ATP-binding protein [Hyphomicrobiales bacterium]
MTAKQMLVKLDHTPENSDFRLNVDLQLPATGINVIFGRSGSGKTSLLRLIAGLDRSLSGRMKLSDEVWQDETTFTPIHKRNIGYIFQEASLFSHLTARENLVYAQKRARQVPILSFAEIVEFMGIGNVLEQYPAQLSGGEKQRIAIARALLFSPQLLLMDEPLASLDRPRKQEILALLERVRDEFGIPIIYVTHSMDEVARLADQLIILDAGQMVAQGSLRDVLPRLDLPIALGDEMGVVIEATIAEHDEEWQLARADFAGGGIWLAAHDEAIGDKLRLRILARDVSLSNTPMAVDSSILNGLKAVVSEIKTDNHPAMRMVQLQVGENLILARITNKSLVQLGLVVGGEIWANVKSVSVTR